MQCLSLYVKVDDSAAVSCVNSMSPLSRWKSKFKIVGTVAVAFFEKNLEHTKIWQWPISKTYFFRTNKTFEFFIRLLHTKSLLESWETHIKMSSWETHKDCLIQHITV